MLVLGGGEVVHVVEVAVVPISCRCCRYFVLVHIFLLWACEWVHFELMTMGGIWRVDRRRAAVAFP